jgi:hypothetical protein
LVVGVLGHLQVAKVIGPVALEAPPSVSVAGAELTHAVAVMTAASPATTLSMVASDRILGSALSQPASTSYIHVMHSENLTVNRTFRFCYE